MEKTLIFTQIAPGILRMRLSETHGVTLAERYGILTLPEKLSDSGMKVEDGRIVLPDGNSLPFELAGQDEYESLLASLSDEFKDKYTDYQAIIGAPAENEKPSPIPVETIPTDDHFALKIKISESARFYGLGEGSRDSIELRGRAYQNWVRYQYNEIPIPLVISSEGWGIWLNALSRSFYDIGGRVKDELICLGEDDELDVFFLYGGSIGGVLKLYTELT